MNLKSLSSEGKIAYLIKPIWKVLQEAGGQLERSEIKERITDMDDQIAEYSVLEKKCISMICWHTLIHPQLLWRKRALSWCW